MVAEEIIMENKDQTQVSNQQVGSNQPSGLKKAAYISVIVFFGGLILLGAFATYTFVSTVNKAEEAVAPLSELVKELFVPVTPVILPDPYTLLKQINDEARLMTVSADYEQIVTAERNSDVLWGAFGETMIFQGVGKVTAGIDLAEMAIEDIQVIDPVTVQIHLPESKIFDDLPILDTEKSKVLDRDTGLLARPDAQLETQMRQAAEAQILAAAQESDIVERADYNAQQQMMTLLQGLGFENVIFSDDPLPPATPYVQEVPKGFVLTPVVTPVP